jgi:hypothetical protein
MLSHIEIFDDDLKGQARPNSRNALGVSIRSFSLAILSFGISVGSFALPWFKGVCV